MAHLRLDTEQIHRPPHNRATSPALPDLPGHDATAGHTLKNTQYFRKNSWCFRIFCQYFRKNCQYFRFPQARYTVWCTKNG